MVVFVLVFFFFLLSSAFFSGEGGAEETGFRKISFFTVAVFPMVIVYSDYLLLLLLLRFTIKSALESIAPPVLGIL